MKEIILIGAGGHAAELREYLDYHNKVKAGEELKLIGLLDDDKGIYDHYNYEAPYLGKINEHEVRDDVHYLMGIANLKYRKQFIEEFLKKGAQFLTFIHPTALIASTANIGEGVVISHNASVGPMATIGDYCLLNSRCTIGHDSVMGKFNFISPQVAVSGNTTIGENNLLGTNSATIPGITIGNGNLIGAGAVVIKDVPDGVTVVGNKARILKR